MLLIHSGFIRSRAFNKLYYIKMSPALLIGGKIDFVTAFFKPLADFVRSIIVIIKNTGDCTAYNWCRHGCSAFDPIGIRIAGCAGCDPVSRCYQIRLAHALKCRSSTGNSLISLEHITGTYGDDLTAASRCSYSS